MASERDTLTLLAGQRRFFVSWHVSHTWRGQISSSAMKRRFMFGLGYIPKRARRKTCEWAGVTPDLKSNVHPKEALISLCLCIAAKEIFFSLHLCFAFTCFPFISFSRCGETISQNGERQRGLGEQGGGARLYPEIGLAATLHLHCRDRSFSLARLKTTHQVNSYITAEHKETWTERA